MYYLLTIGVITNIITPYRLDLNRAFYTHIMTDSIDTPKSPTNAEIAPSEPFALTKSYRALLSRLKDKIRGARLRAAIAINREVIELYWNLVE